MSSAKWWSFGLGLNVLKHNLIYNDVIYTTAMKEAELDIAYFKAKSDPNKLITGASPTLWMKNIP